MQKFLGWFAGEHGYLSRRVKVTTKDILKSRDELPKDKRKKLRFNFFKSDFLPRKNVRRLEMRVKRIVFVYIVKLSIFNETIRQERLTSAEQN